MRMKGCADNPIHAVTGWRFYRKLKAPRFDKCGQTLRTPADRCQLIAKPGFEPFGVVDSSFMEAGQGPNLGTMAFPCPISQIVQVLKSRFHAELLSHLCYGFGIDRGQTWRESAMDSEKQKE